MSRWEEIVLPPTCKRQPKNADDFGDEDTIGAHVKRRGKDITTLDIHKDFGVFAGQRADDTWVVKIKGIMGDITGEEWYSTLESLKKEWMLD